MSELNVAFPIFSRNELIRSPQKIADAVLRKGVCYITGYEENFDRLFAEYNSLKLSSDGTIKVLSPALLKKEQSDIYSVMFAPELKAIKRQVLGSFYRDEIEIFCQHSGPSNDPPSGGLHFDKRPTFKSWYYLNDIGPAEGPMRVVPPDLFEEHSPIAIRKKIGTRALFHGTQTQHKACDRTLKILEAGAELVTGPRGTLFLHITEAWHGASPVMPGSERKIVRAHSRPFADFFIR